MANYKPTMKENQEYNFNKERKKLKNKISFDADGGINVIGIIIVFIIAIIIMPFVSFVLGYFLGWIAKLVIGKWLVAGFALLRLPIELNDIPLLAATLGWIGSYFRNSISSKNEN